MPRVGLSRSRVIEAGAELSDDVGFEQVSVSALARRLDVKAASLYSHVQGSHDLRTGIALMALEELAERCSAAVAGRAGGDALSALTDAYRDYAHAHPGRYAAARMDLDSTTAAASAGTRHAELARAVLRDYRLTGPDQTHAVRLIGSVVHGFVSLELSGSFSHSAPDAQVSWRRIQEALDTLLKTWPAA